MKTIKKPWGKEEILLEEDNKIVKLLYINKNSKLSYQYHKNKKEKVMCIRGNAFSTIMGIKHQIPKDVFIDIHPYVRHRYFTLDKNSILLEICYGKDEDIIRLKDDYSRC